MISRMLCWRAQNMLNVHAAELQLGFGKCKLGQGSHQVTTNSIHTIGKKLDATYNHSNSLGCGGMISRMLCWKAQNMLDVHAEELESG
jgi:hypothetical protein